METEDDNTYYPLGDFMLFDARKILPRLEQEKIRFQIDTDHSGLAGLPPATAGYGLHGNGSKISIYIHREDEDRFRKISHEFFKL